MNPLAPQVLGRGVVAAPGARPDGFDGQPRIRVDADVLADPAAAADAIARLRGCWATRTSMVVELGVDPAVLKQPETEPRAPYQLDAGFSFLLEQLRFLVWANTYDARSRSGPPIWWHGRLAERLGAQPSERADVRLADGTHVWVDGGPRGDAAVRHLPLVHRESVETGRLGLARHRPPGEALADDQLTAVSHDAGPARIVAPAGSGKTRVLAARLRHLLADRGVEADLVTAVAYNRRAADELAARTADLVVDGTAPKVRTIHSLGFAVVRAACPGVRLLDEHAQRDLVAELAPVTPQPNTDVYGPYLEALGRVRMALVAPEQVERERGDVPGFARLFDGYRQRLADANVIDYDEQIYTALEVLLARPDLRARFARDCRHLLVDEFQDLTPAYLLLLRLVAAPAWQVFGVGDDDQTIYSYAGASPTHLIDYDRFFPHAGSHALQVNYRCPPAVVEAAATLLAHNTRRVAKTVRAHRTGPAQALQIVADDVDTLAVRAVETVQAHLDAGAAAEQVAVLARVNALLLPVQLGLLAAGIPAVSAVGVEVLARTGVATVLAWLRLACAGARMDGADLAEAVKRSPRKIRGPVLRRLASQATWTSSQVRRLAFDELAVWEGKQLRGFLDDLAKVAAAARMSTAATLQAVRDTGLDAAMGQLDVSSRDAKRSSSHVDDLDALAQVAPLHPQAATFETWLRDQLTGADRGRAAKVQLDTVHRSKGLEFDHVVVYAANAAVMPHRLAGAGVDEQEEERRIFHVALTRCRESVTVVADRAAPSPYLDQLRHPPRATRAGAPPSRLAPRRRSAPAHGHPPRRVPKAPGVVAAAGLRVTVSGGISGVIETIDAEEVVLRLRSGATLRVPFGVTVTVDGRSASLRRS